MDYFKLLGSRALPQWPYPVEYGEETRDNADVLIIGGGMAGCFAAIHAARRGASVIVAEKGATIRSGAAGSGIDHWMFCATNPASAMSPDEMLQIFGQDTFSSRHMNYVVMNEAYEALLDFEKMGMKVRDTDDDFAGAPFRDEKTKLLFAYAYDGKYCIRLFGGNLKKYLYKEMKRLGVTIYDRVMCTALLTEGGRQGGKVIGATGVNVRTGRFYTFQAKATVLATAKPLRLWEFGTENVGSYAAHDDPNCAGDGDVMAWRAGAKLMMMERTTPSSGMLRYAAYGSGNSSNTWYPATLVDSTGKEIPWVDRDGKELNSVEQRSRCQPGQTSFVAMGPAPYEHKGYEFAQDLPQRIASGEFRYPFYADLTSMPEYERNAIFGLMLCHEGKTRVPILRNLGRSGFDPARDMLQANIVPPQVMKDNIGFWMNGYPGANSDNVREVAFINYGGLVVDWDTKTSLDGLYAIGNQVAGVEGASTAASLGRYCGRIVAKHQADSWTELDEAQIQREKERVYAPLANEEGPGWKEIQIGLCRVMQDYAGGTKTREIMETGLWWLDTIRNTELKQMCVRNPHELARGLECDVRLTAGEIILHNSLARESSSGALSFQRLDFPELVPPEQDCFVAVHQQDGQVCSEKLPLDFWLQGDNAPTYRENYLRRREEE